MTYRETCEYLYRQMPMFERQGSAGYKEGLSNTLALDAHGGHPHRCYKTIHVAGTNGKGSVSHTLAAVLQECGYRVGLYTSPHLVDFRERIRVNGQPVSEDYVVRFVEQQRAFFEPLHPSFFEVTTALAFSYFRDMQVDMAVVEVGLGGRLDCTNIISPILSVITNISFDHTQFLGDTLSKIAGEKAGIIKPGVPVVIGEATSETRPVFEAKAREAGSAIVFAEDRPQVTCATPCPQGGMHYDTVSFGSLDGDLGGIYQQKNLNTVLHALLQLEAQGVIGSQGDHSGSQGEHGDRQAVGRAVARVAQLTGLMGRWQMIQQSPLVVCDTGHNLAGWQYLSQQLRQVDCHERHIVFGMVDDKDVDGVLALLPADAHYYFTKADSHRAIDEHVLSEKAVRHGLQGVTYPTVPQAFQAAMQAAAADDLVFVGGSSYVVGDFLRTVR